ncbi:unnamed protein product [Ranitomeya imitator]|uniref:Uncharacterized protein n=1 Tax=Ranitomeya imitator TaxID=111125 RepID=A0ABN9MJQ1_9NEOB|nr:unnamed protein product [Ranitomeya imitator]
MDGGKQRFPTRPIFLIIPMASWGKSKKNEVSSTTYGQVGEIPLHEENLYHERQKEQQSLTVYSEVQHAKKSFEVILRGLYDRKYPNKEMGGHHRSPILQFAQHSVRSAISLILLQAYQHLQATRKYSLQDLDAAPRPFWIRGLQGEDARYTRACAGAVAEDQKRTSWKEDRRRRSGPEMPIRPDQQWDRPGKTNSQKKAAENKPNSLETVYSTVQLTKCQCHYPVPQVSVSLSCTPSVSAIILYPKCQCHYPVPQVSVPLSCTPMSVPLSCTPSVSAIILYP